MKFLLDTNAVSEPLQQRPDPAYLRWINAPDTDDLALSVLTLGELRKGAGLLGDGARRSRIEAWLSDVIVQFHGRVLDVDLSVANAWAEIAVRHRRQGRVVGAVDELLAATALVHDLTLVTRNLRHFGDSGCKLICPWSV